MIWGEARQPAAKARTMIRFYPKEKRHFRGHKTSVHGKWIMHPSYIVGEEDPYFYSFGITHSNKKGKGHNNHLLAKNPELGRHENAYLRKQLVRDRKNQYTKRELEGFKMSEADDEYVTALLKKRR